MHDAMTIRRTARWAGLLYFTLTLTSVLGILVATQQIVVPGDMEATIRNMQASDGLFRLGFGSVIASAIIFPVLAVMFYRLFAQVDKTQAGILVALVVASVPVTVVAMLTYFAPTVILNGAGYAAALDGAQRKALAILSLDIHVMTLKAVEIFWGLWLLPLGILVIKSNFFPKVLGWLEFVASFGYVLSFVVHFFIPGGSPVLQTIADIAICGEMPFLLWIVILGARFPKTTQGDRKTP